MSHQVCNDVTDWVEEQVLQPVQKCLQQDCNWWCLCCNKWFCWIAWVLVTVGQWVVHTVCEIVADVVDLVVAVVTGVIDVIVGIVTLNWARILDGLAEIVGGAVVFVLAIFRIATLGDTVAWIIEKANTAVLRGYVEAKLRERFGGENLAAAEAAIGVETGLFGLRLKTTANRTFVRSDFVLGDHPPRAGGGSGVPELIRWNNDSSLRLPLKELAGFTFSDFWRRERPELVGDGGSVSESDLDTYLASNGADGPRFSIFALDEGTLQTKLDSASAKARALGIIPLWTVNDVQVKRPDHVRCPETTEALKSFLEDPIGRHDEATDPATAVAELCRPVATAVFFYEERLNGNSAHLRTSTCLDGSAFAGDAISGVTFRDRIPDLVWKWVPIHELGHYFGLCHVDGIDRIMFSPADHNWPDWTFVFEYLWLSGEPRFTLEEGKRAWDYIIANFPDDCLLTRAA